MDLLRSGIESLRAYDVRLFSIGEADVTLFGLAQMLFFLFVLFWFAGWIRTWTAERLLARTHLDAGARQAIGSVLRYVVLIAGLMVIMQTAGINLTTFNVLAGAIGVGVGFGLQEIIKNFVSGIIIMVERPVRIGDSIEVGGHVGEVIDIGARRLTLQTPNNVTVIVPNSKVITEYVKNLQRDNAVGVVRLPLNVSRASDPKLAEQLLYEVAREHPKVASSPEPFVRFNMPTAAAFPMELQLATRLSGREREHMLNELYFAIHRKLGEREVKLA